MLCWCLCQWCADDVLMSVPMMCRRYADVCADDMPMSQRWTDECCYRYTSVIRIMTQHATLNQLCLMLAQRLRRWPNIKTLLVEIVVLGGEVSLTSGGGGGGLWRVADPKLNLQDYKHTSRKNTLQRECYHDSRPVDVTKWTNAGLRLGQRLQRWSKVNSVLGYGIVCVVCLTL